MSDSESSAHSCQCYKKLEAYGIPLHISDENIFLSEVQPMIFYENAFELPGILRISEKTTNFPIVEENELSHVFQQMAIAIPKLSDYVDNVLSFFILDVVIEGLWTAQKKKMNFDHQKITLLWILYFFNYIQKHNPPRKCLFSHLKTLLFHDKKTKGSENTGEFDEISSEGNFTEAEISMRDPGKKYTLPLPPDFSKSDGTDTSANEIESSASPIQEVEAKNVLSSTIETKNQIEESETNVKHMETILEILYRIFARLWVYVEISKAFNSMPSLEHVDLPFTLNTPKRLLKMETSSQVKVDKNGRKPSLVEKSTEAFESLQSLKNDFILPLQMSDEGKLYIKQMFPSLNSQRSALGKKEEKSKSKIQP